jgi:hypothetical protein
MLDTAEITNINHQATMRKLILFMMFGLTAMTINAQEADNATEAGADSIFKAYLYDDEYQVMLNIDFYDQKLIVPGQEIFGELPGWFGSKRDGRKWLITAVDIQGETAMLEITNDYGSEDLTASLTHHVDGTYTLQQINGSTIKIVVDRKWVKIPKKLILKRREETQNQASTK